MNVSIMFTDTSVRDYVISASSVKECEKIFDMIWKHKEESIKDLCKQYDVRSKTEIWCHYQLSDKIITVMEEE